MVEGENGNDGGCWWREKMATMVDGGGRKRLRSEGFEWWVADGDDS
uniref:Uncharacterized protein n=1 Tax=Cucumis melo TaxID=3656 RepID=A0A9I9EEB6_CUCME